MKLINLRDQKESLPATKVISVLSGKGGVGKSVLVFNIAERLSSLGHRVLLVDADPVCGNIHILANIESNPGLNDFLSGTKSLQKTVESFNTKLDILTGNNNSDIDPYNDSFGKELISQIRSNANSYDVVLIDHCSGISEASLATAVVSDRNLLVLVPELTSISDCYGLYKRLSETATNKRCILLANRVQTREESDFIFQRFGAITEQFLGHSPVILGYLSEDTIYRQSVASQRPVAAQNPDSPVTQSLTRTAQSLASALGLLLSGEKTPGNRAINNEPSMADKRE